MGLGFRVWGGLGFGDEAQGALAAMKNIRPQTGQEAAAWIQPDFSDSEALVFEALRVQWICSSFVC